MTPLVLSFREAAKLLRIDRGDTLHELIDRGDLLTIPWGRGLRIPLESVQSLARRGYTVGGRPGRAVSRPRRAGPLPRVGQRIRDIAVEP